MDGRLGAIEAVVAGKERNRCMPHDNTGICKIRARAKAEFQRFRMHGSRSTKI